MSFNEPETEGEDQDLKSVPTEMVYDRQHHLETYKVLRRKIWYNPHVTLPYTQTTQARPDQFYETITQTSRNQKDLTLKSLPAQETQKNLSKAFATLASFAPLAFKFLAQLFILWAKSQLFRYYLKTGQVYSACKNREAFR